MSEAGYQRQLLHASIGEALEKIKMCTDRIEENLDALMKTHRDDYEQALGRSGVATVLNVAVTNADDLDTLLRTIVEALPGRSL